MTNFGQGIGMVLSVFMAARYDFRSIYLVFARLIFLVLPFMPVLFKKETASFFL